MVSQTRKIYLGTIIAKIKTIMEQILKTLQEVQLEAVRRGVHSFHLDTVLGDDGVIIISVAIFLRGDDTDEDYLGDCLSKRTAHPEYEIERIKAFINSRN